MDATTVAVDLAKDVFEVALANRANRIINRKRLTRRQFERFMEGLPAGTDVVMGFGSRALVSASGRLTWSHRSGCLSNDRPVRITFDASVRYHHRRLP